jgi:hypothetical protein
MERLAEEDRWDESMSLFGLPKVVHRKSSAGHKQKKEEKKVDEAEAAEAPPAEGEEKKEE